jgi:transcriptional regulator with XRE-family HTH domain
LKETKKRQQLNEELSEKQLQFRQILGKNLTYFRKARGLTLDNLAEQTGYSSAWLGGVERAQMNSSTDRLAHIADKLGIDLYILFIDRG